MGSTCRILFEWRWFVTIAILSINTPEDDLSNAPDRIEVWASGYVENDENVLEQVVVEKIVLEIEEVGVYAPETRRI